MKFHWFIWFPRVMLVLFSLFLVMFSLDIFNGPLLFIDKIEGFLLQNIPTISLLLILWLSWKLPMWCGFLLILVSFIFTFFFHTYRDIISFLLISCAPFLVGSMFIIVRYMRPKVKKENTTPSDPLTKT
jgi:hypothetical protein